MFEKGKERVMSSNIDSFHQQLQARKEYVDGCLQKYLKQQEAYPKLIHEAMTYAVFNGGKRLRPIMVLEGARIAGGQKESVVPVACAIELIHSYSLVHDDLPSMDDDDFRRGKPTCHKVFGEAIAILAGDALLTAAFELMTKNACIEGIEPRVLLEVIGEIARAVGSRGMIGGQVIDLESEGKKIDYNTLRTLHTLKTGELFQVSLRAGALLNNIDDKGLKALTDYSYHFGLAFQITDDILDIQGNEELTGKPVGSDERNLKNTYPSLLGLDKSYKMAAESVNACLDSLALFGEEANFLRSLASYLLHRSG